MSSDLNTVKGEMGESTNANTTMTFAPGFAGQKKISVYVNSIPLTLQQDTEHKMYKMPRRESKVHPSNMKHLQLTSVGIDTMLSQINKRCSFSSWIRSNIKKKQCCFYVEERRKGICKCGYPKDAHIEEAIKPDDYMGQEYDKQKHMKEVPTDAFGDISFGGIGQKPGKYVRVSSDTPVEDLYKLMTEQWKLQPPNLLISVTGGAKNFQIKTVLKNKFRRGLIKVAQTTGAWILTGGTHTGVMKHVGRAVRDYNLSTNAVGGQIVAIGVATWGVIHNRQSLVHSDVITFSKSFIQFLLFGAI